jgi:hypothetical protein
MPALLEKSLAKPDEPCDDRQLVRRETARGREFAVREPELGDR